MMAAQAYGVVGRVVLRGPGVGIVAGRAFQAACGLVETGRQGQADRLESHDLRVVRVELGPRDGWDRPVALAAKQDLAGRVVAIPSLQDLEVGFPPPDCLDMLSPRPVAPFAGDVGDHRVGVESRTGSDFEIKVDMTVEACPQDWRESAAGPGDELRPEVLDSLDGLSRRDSMANGYSRSTRSGVRSRSRSSGRLHPAALLGRDEGHAVIP